jgi:hypothetical protein
MTSMQVPPFLLRRLYVKGSLRNVGGGFEFQLSNTLGAGYAQAMLPLTVDGEELPMERSFFTLDGRKVAFTEVTEAQPFTLAMNTTTVIRAEGRTLAPGPHRLKIGFVVLGLGPMEFEVTDTVSEDSE